MRWLAARKGLLLPSVALLAALGGTACGSDDSGPDGAGGTAGVTGVTWCEVSQVLEAKCQLCHVGAGLNNAPFALVTYADTQVVEKGAPRYRRMYEQVSQEIMPPTTAQAMPEALTSEEKDVLLTWIDQGAKAVGGQDCAP